MRNGCKCKANVIEKITTVMLANLLTSFKFRVLYKNKCTVSNYFNFFFSGKCCKNYDLIVFLQGANILLTDKGDVKLGELLVIFATFCLYVITSHSAKEKKKLSCHSSFQLTLELQPK